MYLIPIIAKSIIQRAVYSTITSQVMFDITSEFLPKDLEAFIDANIVEQFTRVMQWDTTTVTTAEYAFSRGFGKHVFMLNKIPVVFTVGPRADETGKVVSRYDRLYTFSVPRCFKNQLLELIGWYVVVREDLATIQNIRAQNYNKATINPKYADEEQFCTEDVYQRIDEIFSRMGDKSWYEKMGKAHKESILLYGPPGTAKSTLLRHFVSKYQYDTLVLKPEDYNNHLVTYLGKNSDKPIVLLFEEIDACKALCKQVEGETSFEEMSSFNHSDFINWLNGLTPLDNIIVVMTTNNKSKLLSKVIRNGRVDRKILVNYLSVDHLCKFIGDKWRKEIESYEMGRITVSMIPELREAQSVEEFHELVRVLSDEETYAEETDTIKKTPTAA